MGIPPTMASKWESGFRQTSAACWYGYIDWNSSGKERDYADSRTSHKIRQIPKLHGNKNKKSDIGYIEIYSALQKDRLKNFFYRSVSRGETETPRANIWNRGKPPFHRICEELFGNTSIIESTKISELQTWIYGISTCIYLYTPEKMLVVSKNQYILWTNKYWNVILIVI